MVADRLHMAQGLGVGVMDKFYLLWNSEDGLRIKEFDRAEDLKEELEGDVEGGVDIQIADSAEELGDTDGWDEDVRLIIKGSIVKAKPKTVVKSWDID